MEYKILRNRSSSDLEKEVNSFLKLGWRLQGNLIYGQAEVYRGSYSSAKYEIPMFYQSIFKE